MQSPGCPCAGPLQRADSAVQAGGVDWACRALSLYSSTNVRLQRSDSWVTAAILRFRFGKETIYIVLWFLLIHRNLQKDSIEHIILPSPTETETPHPPQFFFLHRTRTPPC